MIPGMKLVVVVFVVVVVVVVEPEIVQTEMTWLAKTTPKRI